MVASIKPHRDEVGLADEEMLIDGQWAAALAGQTWNHRHPATGEDVATFPVAAAEDVDLAVRAARRAFDEGPWPRARASERIRVLRRIADLVREHGDELLRLQALDNSVPLSFGGVPAAVYRGDDLTSSRPKGQGFQPIRLWTEVKRLRVCGSSARQPGGVPVQSLHRPAPVPRAMPPPTNTASPRSRPWPRRPARSAAPSANGPASRPGPPSAD